METTKAVSNNTNKGNKGAVSPKVATDKAKEADKASKEAVKEAKKSLTANNTALAEAWKNEHKTPNALCKWLVTTKADKVQKSIDFCNAIYGTKLDLAIVTPNLLDFCMVHERNEVDIDCKPIAKKEYFNITLFLRLIERKAKFGTPKSEAFKKAVADKVSAKITAFAKAEAERMRIERLLKEGELYEQMQAQKPRAQRKATAPKVQPTATA